MRAINRSGKVRWRTKSGDCGRQVQTREIAEYGSAKQFVKRVIANSRNARQAWVLGRSHGVAGECGISIGGLIRFPN
jgi:hypothetical protein